MSCRICLEEEGPFVHPCMCKGSTGDVHAECLQRWIDESKKKTPVKYATTSTKKQKYLHGTQIVSANNFGTARCPTEPVICLKGLDGPCSLHPALCCSLWTKNL